MKILILSLLALFLSTCWGLQRTTFQVQPYQLPNTVDFIAEQINLAKKHVDLAIYDFSSDTIYEAIQEGCDNNVTFSMYVDFDENGDSDSNIYQLISDYPDKVQVIFDSWKVHAKFVVIDGTTLLLGSSNWEDDEPDNIEFLLVSGDKKLIKQVIDQFDSIFPNKWNTPPPPQEDDEESDDDSNDDDDKKRAAKSKSKTEFYFERGVASQLLTLIKNSKTSIEGALYKLTNEAFYEALKAAATRGVGISLYLNGEYNDEEGSYSDLLDSTFGDDNFQVVYSNEDTKMHAKFVVFDKKIVALGSANWSPGVESNLEDLIISSDPQLVNQALSSLELMVNENDSE